MTAFVTAEEIGMSIGVKAATVKRWARDGLIPSLRLTGRVLRFDPAAVERTLRERAIVGDNQEAHACGA